ncbi:MAG: hypothetical protein HY690_01695 [Chloroflexi bacterium]|nr:hypothetical protein [Chloroflexota bacterium]
MLLIALLAVSLSLSGCGIVGGAGPAPTPDPFAALSGKSEEFYNKGLEHFDKGEYREALNAFDQARLYSSQADPRIDQAIERARAAINPTATPTNTATPTITPTPRPPVQMSTQQPDEALAQAYFGTTYLTVVPGRESLPPPMVVFWSEYQVSLYVQNLGQTLRQPFTVRVFDLDARRLVGEVSTESPAAEQAARPPVGAPTVASERPSAEQSTPAPTPVRTPAGATPAPAGQAGQLKKWFDRFVWYREGGERPGKYRLELYAGAQLARVLDYEVQANFVPVPTMTPTPTPTETITPTPTGTPVGTPGEPAPGTPGTPGTPGAPATPTTPTPTLTPTPTPAVASIAVTGGLPAGITVNQASGGLYVADASGVVWMVDQNGPVLQRPFVLEGSPVDVVVDPLTGRLYAALKGSGTQTTIAILHGTSGERLGRITIPDGQVTELAINPGAGLLYALVPGAEQLNVVDLRQNAIAQRVRFAPLAQVTGMALDPAGKRLYMSDLTGQLLVFDAADPRNAQLVRVSGPGLSGVAALDDRAFAFNTPGKKVYVVNPAERRVEREIALDQEPGAIAADSQTGLVYVLGTQRPALVRLDPERGEANGVAYLPDRSGRMGLQPRAARDLAGLRSRIAINQFDGSLFITQPEIGTVSVVTSDMFPALGGGGR